VAISAVFLESRGCAKESQNFDEGDSETSHSPVLMQPNGKIRLDLFQNGNYIPETVTSLWQKKAALELCLFGLIVDRVTNG
jgi:hypothetical protein